MVVAEDEHRRRVRGPRRSSSHSSCSAEMRPRSVPGRTVSSTASVTPGELDGKGPRRRDRLGDHRVVIAAHVVHAHRRAACTPRRNAAYSSSVPRSVRSPFTTTASGSSRSIASIAPRFITSGYGVGARLGREHRAELLGRPEQPALGLAEVHVVHRRERGEQPARRLRQRGDLGRQQRRRLGARRPQPRTSSPARARRPGPSGTAPRS